MKSDKILLGNVAMVMKLKSEQRSHLAQIDLEILSGIHMISTV